jgi:RNA polymerase sigma-70 factor (ECF subfamily)
MDDQTAITRIKQGDLNGLEGLVERYQTRAVQAAYLIVFDHDLAEDIAQGAFIKAAERIHQFDETRPFEPWFYRIVVNDALKATRTQQRTVPFEHGQDDGPVSKIVRCLATTEPLPEQQIEQDELRRSILEAVRSLPPEQRMVITMRYFLDLSQADMSTQLNRPLSTIKWWLYDARNRLRGLLDGLR